MTSHCGHSLCRILMQWRKKSSVAQCSMCRLLRHRERDSCLITTFFSHFLLTLLYYCMSEDYRENAKLKDRKKLIDVTICLICVFYTIYITFDGICVCVCVFFLHLLSSFYPCRSAYLREL